MSEKKSVTVNINSQNIYILLVGITIGFIVVFTLQSLKTVSSNLFHPKLNADNSFWDRYYENYNLYVLNLSKDVERLKLSNDLSIEYAKKQMEYGMAKTILENTNRYPSAGIYSYNSCRTQVYTSDFRTFFGNVVLNDREKYGQYTELPKDKYTEQQIATMLKDPDNIIYTDRYWKLDDWYIQTSPPSFSIEKKYRKFDVKFSQCDFNSSSHKAYIRFKGMLKDWFPATVIGFIISLIIYLVRRFKVIVKIN